MHLECCFYLWDVFYDVEQKLAYWNWIVLDSQQHDMTEKTEVLKLCDYKYDNSALYTFFSQ